MLKSPLSFHAQNWSASNSTLADDTQFSHFILSVGKPFVNYLLTEIEKALEETSPVLSAFNIFNSDRMKVDQQENLKLVL